MNSATNAAAVKKNIDELMIKLRNDFKLNNSLTALKPDQQTKIENIRSLQQNLIRYIQAKMDELHAKLSTSEANLATSSANASQVNELKTMLNEFMKLFESLGDSVVKLNSSTPPGVAAPAALPNSRKTSNAGVPPA